jgi:subtilisin family serine protease
LNRPARGDIRRTVTRSFSVSISNAGVSVMSRRFPFVRPLLLAVAAGLLASCQDSPEPTGLDPSDLVTARQVVNGPGDYILDVAAARMAAVRSAVADLGGAVIRSHADAGILIVGGLSPTDADALADIRGVRAIMADVAIQGDPGLTNPAVEQAGEAADPTDAYFYQIGYQWDMEIIQADDAWLAGASAEGVTVAILDSGIDPNHADLQGLVDATRSVAFVANANPNIPDWADDRFHGTHVAGIVATNGIGTAGVAPGATLVSVKVCNWQGSCPFSAILSGIIYAAEHDSDVINLSLGGLLDRSDAGAGAFYGFLSRVMNYAALQGTLVVAAAGNDGLDLDHLGRDYRVGPYKAVPCESGNGMCVSATNVLDEATAYTNYGVSAVSVAAPGGDNNFAVWAPCATGSVFLPLVGINCGPLDYLGVTGTSMAAPHVSGAAALVVAAGWTVPGQVKTTLQRSADDLGKPGTDPFFGKGRLNVLSALGG